MENLKPCFDILEYCLLVNVEVGECIAIVRDEERDNLEVTYQATWKNGNRVGHLVQVQKPLDHEKRWWPADRHVTKQLIGFPLVICLHTVSIVDWECCLKVLSSLSRGAAVVNQLMKLLNWISLHGTKVFDGDITRLVFKLTGHCWKDFETILNSKIDHMWETASVARHQHTAKDQEQTNRIWWSTAANTMPASLKRLSRPAKSVLLALALSVVIAPIYGSNECLYRMPTEPRTLSCNSYLHIMS